MDRKQVLASDVGDHRPPSSNVSVDSHTSEGRNDELPPAYTANGALRVAPDDSNTITLNVQAIPPLNFSSYRPAASTISKDHTTITTSHRPYTKSATALAEFIRQQASLPPRPVLRLTGLSHGRTDFDVKVNLLPYLCRPSDPWNYLSINSTLDSGDPSSSRRPSFRRSQSSTQSLEAWAKEYCSDQSSLKTFTLERQLVNFDLNGLSGMIRNTFAEIGYQGRLEIRLEISFAKVVVDNQSTKGAGAFFRPLVSAFMGTKNFEAVKAVWPFARSGPDQEHTGVAREFATTSEAAWWKEWKIAVAKAAFESRRGWVTVEDRLEVVMTGWLQDGQIRPWGSSDTIPE